MKRTVFFKAMAKPLTSAQFNKIIRDTLNEQWQEILFMNTVYVFHYGDHVRLQFGPNGPHIGMPEKDLPEKIKYAIAARGLKEPTIYSHTTGKATTATVAVQYEAKEFNELAASVNLMLVPR
jgi:hypothetical protein